MDLFAPATVLRLRGAGAPLNHLNGWCNGIFDRPPYTAVDIAYPANLNSNSISEGVRLFDEKARSTPGRIICLCHSQGCQVATDWMRKYQDDPTAPGPDRLMFVLTGNLARNPTGNGIGKKAVDGSTITATPTTMRWRIIDVARARDGWAIKGPMFSPNWWGMFFTHTNYKQVDLTKPPTQELRVGHTHSVVYP